MSILSESFDQVMNNDKNRINVDLDKKLSERFGKIKEKMGLMHDTEVIRSLIQDKYNQLYPNG